MFLKKLILNDLLRFSSKGSNNTEVASEEAIRLMLYIYQRENKLVNPMLMLSTNVMDFLRQKSNDKIMTHYQLVVESGSRNGLHPGDKANTHYNASASQNQLHQGDHGSVHYTAMDVYCDETGKVTVFFADHHHGKNYYGYKYPSVQPDFPVHFIAAGSTLYQTDESHCPIFTLQHLLLTAHDDDLRNRLVNMPQSADEIPTKLRWFDLPPHYNLNTQSTSQINNYYNHMERKETKISGVVGSNTVRQCLTDAQFFSALSNNLEWCNSRKKFINAGIQNTTIQYAHDMFSSIHLVTERDLINICYADRYPIFADILMNAINISESSAAGAATSGHPLFDFIFSNQALFKLLSHKTIATQTGAALFALLNNEVILTGIKMGFIDLNALSTKIFTVDGSGQIKINSTNLKIILKNIPVLEILLSEWVENKKPPLLSENTLALLLLQNGAELFTIDPIKQLYFSGNISSLQLSKIQMNRLKTLSLANLNQDEVKLALEQIGSPASVARAADSPASCRLELHGAKLRLFQPVTDEPVLSLFPEPECLPKSKDNK